MKFLAAVAAALLATATPALAATFDSPPGATANRIVLPTDVRPDRYAIRIAPDAAALTFTGHVDIDLTVVKATSKIVLNAADLTFGKVTLSGVEGSLECPFYIFSVKLRISRSSEFAR